MGSHRAPDSDAFLAPGAVVPETAEIDMTRPPAPHAPPPLRRDDPAVPAAGDDHLSGGQGPVDTVLPEAPVYPETRGAPIDWKKRPKPQKPQKVSARPEPVLNAAKIAGALAGVILALGGLLRLVGIVDIGDADLQRFADAASNAVLATGVLWATVGPWVLARWRARPHVTPLADPRDARGQRLVPED